MIKKFRVWDKKSCVYRDLVDFAVDGAGQLFERTWSDSVIEVASEDHYTVEFSTGFKGDDGNEIYEGDIVDGSVDYCHPLGDDEALEEFKGMVKYYLDGAGFSIEDNNGHTHPLFRGEEEEHVKSTYAIIGNSHDSPKAKEE